MKKITSIMVLAMALAWVSCTPEDINGPVNDIEDHTVTPEAAVELTLTDSKSTWSTDRRYFDLTFDTALTTTLVGYEALLTPGQYVLGADEIGNAILAKTKVNGADPQEGFITVTKKDANYVISAKIDGHILNWTGSLPFTADPDPVRFTVVNQAASYASYGYKQLNLQLATAEGVANNWGTWMGEGEFVSIDLYTEDAYIHEGIYLPCEQPGVIGEGQFGIGYDSDYGVQGSYLASVSAGAATIRKIDAGMIKVTSREETVNDKDVTIWSISWGVEYPEEIIFEGELPSLTKPKASAEFAYTYKEEELQPVSDQTGAVVAGVMKHPVTILNADGETVAYFEILLAEGETDLSGEFPSTSYAAAAGLLADGWEFDGTAWGMGFMSGGSYFINGAGEKVLMFAGQWTLNVVKLVTGAYEFIGVPVDPSAETFDIKACGEGYVPGSYKDPDALQVYTMTDTVAQDCTLEDGQTAVTDVESHTLVLMDGETFVAQIKLIRSVGVSDLTGEYTVKEYAHEDYAAGNGFDLGIYFGMPAGSFVIGSYYVKDGEIVIVEPGETITVTSAGDNTLKFVGSTGYTFVGKL